MTMFAQEGVGQILDYIQKGGMVALLIIILYGGFKPEPWWVFGREYRGSEKRSDEWKQMAIGTSNNASRAVETAQSAVEVRREVLEMVKTVLENGKPKPRKRVKR